MGGFDYAMFAAEEAISGALVLGGCYQPSKQGSVVYFNCSDITPILNIITELGNEILVPRTAINNGERGYFAQFFDSEGNRVGLYSKQ